MQNLLFTLNVVAPVFLIVLLGIILKSLKQIDENFISVSSKIVFNVTLPAFVFIKLAFADFGNAFNLKLIIFSNIALAVAFIFTWLVSLPLAKDGKDRGAFIQASVRSNYAIVGFAIIFNMCGNSGLSKAAVLLAFVMPIFNFISVIALSVPLHQDKQTNIRKTLFDLFTNPLILAVFASLPFSYYKISFPQFLISTIDYLAALTLPLALLAIGGTLNFSRLKRNLKLTLLASTIKIIIIPLLLTIIAIRFGFRGDEIGILFILFATPSAIVSFIMAKAMGSNFELTGNIIVATTLGSVITITFGIYLIKTAGFL